MLGDLELGSFHWSECEQRCRAEAQSRSFVLDARGHFFEAPGLRITPPLVFPTARRLAAGKPDAESAAEHACRQKALTGPGLPGELEAYLDGLPLAPGDQAVILMQAGAASLGYFRAGKVLATKSFKRYVVRGKGRAQPAFLKTKGKSRYGSRLRLQNARRLVDEINEKLCEFWSEFGKPDQIFVGAPIQLWPDLFRGACSPPFARNEPFLRIPLDLPVPTTDVLMRAYKSLCFGRIERTGRYDSNVDPKCPD